MPALLLGGFVVVHGLITTMIGVMGVASPNAPSIAPPAWFNWWPGPFGRSWLIDGLHLGTGGAIVGGLLWLVAGLALVGAGAGYLGAPVVREQWPLLAVAGATVGLAALFLYFHPLYLVAVVIDMALIVLLWGRLSPAAG